VIQWPDEKLNAFKAAIQRARKKREAVAEEYGWDDNRERYVPKPKRDSQGVVTHDVNVGADFRDVERKKAALLYDTPEIALTPDEPDRPVSQPNPMQPQQPQLTIGTLVSWHQELVNGLLGPRHANVKPVMLKGLFDVLCPSGVGVFKAGYETRTVPVEAPQIGPDGMPAMNPITGQPLTRPVDLPIWERWFISRVSPMGLLIPADFKDTDHALAPWIGYDYCLPASHARRVFNLGDDWKPKGTDAKKPYFDAEEDAKYTADDPPVIVSYIEYKAEYYAEPGQVVHPEQINQLILVDDRVVKNDPHPDQTIDPQTARLTLDSINTFTVKTLTIRDYSDSAWVASDCTATGALTKEINKYRTVTVKQRDGQRNIVLYDPSKLTADARAKIEKGDISTWVPVDPDALMAAGANGSGIMQQVTTIQQGRESYIGQDYIERDRDKILGLADNQVGANTQTKRTATESSIVQRNSEARFEQERQRVLECYLHLVRTFDTLVLRYCDARNASLILGPQKGQLWAQHKAALLGGYHYELQVDSAKYMDVEANRRQWLQVYSQLRPDPNVNAVPILKKVASAFGLDPAEVVVAELPEKKPDPPKVTIAISADQFNPALPQFPIVVEIARQGGFNITPETVLLAQQQVQAMGLSGRSPVSGEQETVDTPDPNDPMGMGTIQSPAGPSSVPAAGVAGNPGATKQNVHPGAMSQAPSLSKHLMNESGNQPGPTV
jgi:hypothetical protein